MASGVTHDKVTCTIRLNRNRPYTVPFAGPSSSEESSDGNCEGKSMTQPRGLKLQNLNTMVSY